MPSINGKPRQRELSSTQLERITAKDEQTQCECPTCSKVIIDPPNENYQSTFCDGECQIWLYKSGAGLTEQAFCTIQIPRFHIKMSSLYHKTNITTSLVQGGLPTKEHKANELETQLTRLATALQPLLLLVLELTPLMCAAYPNPTCLILKLEFNVAQKQGSCTRQEIRFVIYGIFECQQGTPRHTRMSSDLTSAQNLASKYAPKYLFRRNLPAKINPIQRVNKQLANCENSDQPINFSTQSRTISNLDQDLRPLRLPALL